MNYSLKAIVSRIKQKKDNKQIVYTICLSSVPNHCFENKEKELFNLFVKEDNPPVIIARHQDQEFTVGKEFIPLLQQAFFKAHPLLFEFTCNNEKKLELSSISFEMGK